MQSRKHQKDYLKCDLVTFASKVEAQIESEPIKDLHLCKFRLLKDVGDTIWETVNAKSQLIKYRNMNTILKQTVKITCINNMHVKKTFKSSSLINLQRGKSPLFSTDMFHKMSSVKQREVVCVCVCV